MTAPILDEYELPQRGMDQLRVLLGEGWEVRSLDVGDSLWRYALTGTDQDFDAVWTVRNTAQGSLHGEIIVEAKSNLTPGAVTKVLGPRLSMMRQAWGDATVLVISPWLSPRTRQVLDNHRLGYLDLTGNVSIRLDQPAIVIKTDGAQHNPTPQAPPRRGLSGPRAGRLVRALVDYRPPRRPRELAVATKVSESYVSRLLDAMRDEALIDRAGRLITRVDWQALLRSRASSYHMMKANHVVPALARQGRGRLLDTLRHGTVRHPVLATGSFAAATFAPTAVGGALMIYVPPGVRVVDEVARDLALLRVDQATDADVLLLQPMSNGVFDRPHPEPIDGIACVGISQLVLDCLSGPGRMPAEGEALLSWMAASEELWRLPSPLDYDDGV